LPRPARLRRPGRQASGAQPRGKPGFSTLDCSSGRETDSLLEGDGFEPSVPPVGNYAHETALFDRHGIFRPFLDRRRTRSGIVHTAKCLIAEGRLLGDNELRQIQELGSAVVMAVRNSPKDVAQTSEATANASGGGVQPDNKPLTRCLRAR
jgi:hypothetical protein